jgi:hypothetical protein
LRKAGAIVHLLSGLSFPSFFPLSRHSRFSRLHFSLLSIAQLVPTQTGTPLTWFNQNSLVFLCVERVEFSYMARKIIARTMAEFVNEAAGKEHTRHAKKSRHALNYISETFFEQRDKGPKDAHRRRHKDDE